MTHFMFDETLIRQQISESKIYWMRRVRLVLNDEPEAFSITFTTRSFRGLGGVVSLSPPEQCRWRIALGGSADARGSGGKPSSR
jgi:hypothetical protein